MSANASVRCRFIAMTAVAIGFLVSQAALADGVEAPIILLQQKASSQNLYSFDYGIPASPALTLIGTSTDKLTPSSTLKPYDFSVPASFGGPKDSQSFTADFTPAWVLESQQPTYDEYYQDWGVQIAHRARFSGAFYPGDKAGGDATKAKSSRLAFGANVSLLGGSDPLAVTAPGKSKSVWVDCLNNVLTTPQYASLRTLADQMNANYNKANNVLGAVQAAQLDLQKNYDKAIAAVRDCLGVDGPCLGLTSTDALSTAFKLDSSSDAAKAHQIDQLFEAMGKVMTDLQTASVNKQGAGVSDAFTTCVQTANTAARFGSDIDIGAGVMWTGKPGAFEGFTDAAGAVWLAGHVPIGSFNGDLASGKSGDNVEGRAIMLGGSARASWKETVATGDAVTSEGKANVIDAWLGLELYAPTFRMAAQGGYNRTHFTDIAASTFSKSGFRWQVSASARLGDVLGGIFNTATSLLTGHSNNDQSIKGAWLNATYGSSGGTTTALDDKTFLISVSFSPNDPYDLFGESPKSSGDNGTPAKQ